MSPNRIAVALAATTLVVACKGKDETAANDTTAAAPPPAAATTPADSVAAAGGAQMSDANILARLRTGDSGEVALGKLAQSNASDAGVKSFGSLLVSDHTKGMKQVDDVAKKASLTPQSAPSDTTAQAAQHAMEHLKSLKGKDFDTAFVAHEVSDHKEDIDDTKKAQGMAQNADVKKLLDQTLPALQKHLDRAQQLQSRLGGTRS